MPGPLLPALAWQTLSPFSQGWPVRLGWLSLLLLMLGLAATFATRLPYRSWRWLHVSLGVGVLVGLWHLLQLGIEEPVLPILALAALFLGWRLLREDSGLAARPYIVQSAAPVADGMVEITLKPLAEPIAATAGQFVLVAFFAGPTFRGCGEFHPFTVSSMGADRQIRVGVKALGDCTRRIQSIEPGVLARVHGAFGTFLAERPAAPQLWLAGGIGITPFLALLRAGPLSQETRLVYLYRAEADAAFLQELRALAERDPQLSLQALATGNEPPNLDSLLPEARALPGTSAICAGRRACWPRSDSPSTSAASSLAISILKTSDSDNAQTLPIHHRHFLAAGVSLLGEQPVVAAGRRKRRSSGRKGHRKERTGQTRTAGQLLDGDSRHGLRSERLSAPASVAPRDCSALVRQGSNRGL
jgi:ferredoxin-NADP reductase